MKIFAIFDGENAGKEEIGYLFCYEKAEEYIIELNKGLDEWTAPLLFTQYVKKGKYTIPKSAAGMWVAERVIPSGRQNIGMILKNHGESEYREYKLLALSKGYSSQDACYIKEIKSEGLSGWVRQRQQTNIRECFLLNSEDVICLLYDDSVLRLNIKELGMDQVSGCSVDTGGYGIRLDDRISIDKDDILAKGKKLTVSAKLFYAFAKRCVVNTGEACDILCCSRQNLSYHTGSGRLTPLKHGQKETLFLKGEVEKAGW